MPDTAVAIASCCDEPAWAEEALDKFEVEPGASLRSFFTEDCSEIYKANKQQHLTALKERLRCEFAEMMVRPPRAAPRRPAAADPAQFLDNQLDNCRAVAKLGVTVVFTPAGVGAADWDNALARFPAPGEILRA